MKEFLFKKVNTKKGIIFLIVFFLVSLFTIQAAKKKDFLSFYTGFIGIPEKAVLSLSPTSKDYNVGDEFSVSVFVNTAGQNVVAVGAYLSYDPTKLKVINIDTSNSVFGTSYELINYNGSAPYTPAGKIEIVKAKPSPGVRTSNGLVAIIKFKALASVTPSQDNLTFDFVSSYASGDSDVILDDGEGTDILSGVDNGRYRILETGVEITKIKIELEGKKKFDSSFKLFVYEKGTNNLLFQTTETSDTFGEAEIEISLTDLPTGNYDFKIVAPYYLSKEITNVAWPTEIEIEFDNILAGNLYDKDNEINSLDWDIMKSDWGSSQARSDINQDGIVNTVDWSFLNKNWGKRGD